MERIPHLEVEDSVVLARWTLKFESWFVDVIVCAWRYLNLTQRGFVTADRAVGYEGRVVGMIGHDWMMCLTEQDLVKAQSVVVSVMFDFDGGTCLKIKMFEWMVARASSIPLFLLAQLAYERFVAYREE